MSAPHRPLSEWVTEVTLDRDGTGSWDPWAEPNLGDRDADARGEPRFGDGWSRRRIPLETSGTRAGVLGLTRGTGPDEEAVAELTDAGVPVPVGEAAITVVERLEETWPYVRPEPADLRVLAAESPALRWSLVERLRQEGDPAALFHILPWELVERLAGDLIAAVEAGGGASGVLLMHWFAPTGSRFSDAMDEMNLWLRDHGTSELADHGGFALCEELVHADLALFPARTLRALAALTRRLTAVDPAMHDMARLATAKLTSAAAVPDLLDIPPAVDRLTSGPDAAHASGPSQAPPPSAESAAMEAVTEWLGELAAAGPGQWTMDSGGTRAHLTVTAGEDGGEVALETTPPVGDAPVLVRAEDDRGTVVYLGRLIAGRMSLAVGSPPPYEVRPRPGTPGARVEAFTSEPRRLQLAVASDVEEEPRDDRLLVVPDLDLEVTAYEAGDGRLYVSASAGSRDADGRWVELALHDPGDGSVRECVIPLRWAHDAAEGTLSVGTWRDRLTVAVGAGLVDDPSGFTPEAVRWSAEHAADERTGDALRDLLAALGDPGGTA